MNESGRENCPVCQQRTLPTIEPESTATARKCQNPECGAIVDRSGEVIR